jgi:hypothetical protein
MKNENKLRPVWRGNTDQLKNIIWKRMASGRKAMVPPRKKGKLGVEKRRSLGEVKGFTRYPGKPLTKDQQSPRGRSPYEIAMANFESGAYGTPDNPHRGSSYRAAFWNAYHGLPDKKHTHGSIVHAHALAGRDAAKKKKSLVKEETIYHVTHTKHVPKIQKHGILPMQTSNWVKAGNKERYGSGEVYAFTHKDDAKAWAGKMDWAHNKTLGSGKISIITSKRPTDREFEDDTSDPLSQAGSKGKWVKTRGNIGPEHIQSVEPYTPKKLGEDSPPQAGLGAGAFASVEPLNMNPHDPVLTKKTKKVIKMKGIPKKKIMTTEAKDLIGKKTPSKETIAAKHGIPVDRVEAQIMKGVKVEREHTNSDAEAEEIARDHLHEFPDYYDRLDKMETKAKKSMKEETDRQKRDRVKKFMMKKTPQIAPPKTPLPVPAGTERVKVMGFNVLRRKILKDSYDPEKEAARISIEGHKRMEQKMREKHGDASPQASFHRYWIRRLEKELKEDAPAMSVGAGVVAGMPTADSADQTPVRRKKPDMLRRTKTFAGKKVFVVDPTTYHEAYLGKRKYEHYEKYLKGCDIADEIREFGRKYWAEPIIIENEQTGAMVYLKYGSR